MTRRRIFALALAGFAGGILASRPVQGAPFTDVTGDLQWVANALGNRRVLPPVWGNVLAPGAPMYRYEMAWILAALLDPKEHPFSVTAWPDVPPGYWALQAVNQCVGAGLMKEEEGKFNGDRRVRRYEFITAVDQLLKYRAIPPPPPKAGRIRYPDATGALAEVADRAANYWQFLEPEPRLRPGDSLTRGEAVAILVKAAPLVDRTFLTVLATPTPSPKATRSPGTVTASPNASPTEVESSPSPDATGSSETPRPQVSLPPLSWRFSLAPAVLAIGVSPDFAGGPATIPLGGGDADLAGWAGPVGGRLRLNARVFPGSAGGKSDTFYQVNGVAEGLWRLGLDNADLAVGGGAGVSYQARTTSSVSSADRTFVGGGPAAMVVLPLGPLALEAGGLVQVGAAIPASSGGSVSSGFGLSYHLDARFALPIATLEAIGGYRGQLVNAGSRTDFMSGLLIGLGGGF
jgi:hypothetical protein